MTQQRPHQWEVDLDPLDQEDREILEQAERDPNAITTGTIIRQKLGFYSTCCMILNRVIGTGIFSTPADILKATGSPGAALLLWAAGGIISFAGLMIYMEFGLSIPRYTQNGVSRAVPRSGGEKNYLEYVYKAPKYFTTCVYGVVFIILGNTAGNAISFGQHVLRARGYAKDDIDSNSFEWPIKGIAVASLTGACLLHGAWRAGGIWVNNFFATVKCLLLFTIIVAGIFFSAGGGGDGSLRSTYNLDPQCSFVSSKANGTVADHCPKDTAHLKTPESIYGFSQSLLLIIFAYGGFENASYILSEINRPRRTYKWASLFSLGLVTVLYMLTIIVYFIVVPRGTFHGDGAQLALYFFGRVMKKHDKIENTVSSFIAFSSLGNIIVVTFVASRVKQEIAKEGVFPFSRIIARDSQTLFSWLRNTSSSSGSGYSYENTPIGALFLHWVFSVILVISPSSRDAYLFLLLLYSYAIHVLVGFFLAVGLIYLHLKPKSTWSEDRGFKPFGSWVWALIYAVANFFIICVAWMPPQDDTLKKLFFGSIEYWVYPTVATALILIGAIYWVGFAHFYPKFSKRVLDVRRFPIVQEGVQVYEAVFFNWVVPHDLDSDDDTTDTHEHGV